MDNLTRGFRVKRYEPRDLVENPMESFDGDLDIDIFDEEDKDKVLDECFVKVTRDGNLSPRKQRKGFKTKKTHERKHNWDSKVSKEVIRRQLPMRVTKNKEIRLMHHVIGLDAIANTPRRVHIVSLEIQLGAKEYIDRHDGQCPTPRSN
ncbi:hypothetical protein FXO38_18594 [Capsicum annuum]|nr:hypothetical protein FXO38_18594 [Capsicum annuum]